MFKKFPILKTKRIILKKINSECIEDILNLYSNKKVCKYLQRNPMKNNDEAEEFINNNLEMFHNKKGIRWGIFLKENEHRLVGTYALHYYSSKNKRIELGADLLPNYWSKGLISELTNKIIDFAFKNLDIVRLELRCHPQNKGSIKIAKKFHFKYEGTLRNYVYVSENEIQDELVFSMLKEEWENNYN